MTLTTVFVKPWFFADRPALLLADGSLKATAFRYETGVAGLKIENEDCSMVVLPYMGQQIWEATFHGKNLTQKSIFPIPQNTTKFGDNYGGLLLHCGLTNINGAEEGEDYPLHGELPFANYQQVYTGIGEDEKGRFLAVGGTYTYRNSQEFYWSYSPQLRLYEGKSVLEMHIDIHNKRHAELEYMFMCHMNWLGVEGSRIVYSAKPEDMMPDPPSMDGDSPRAVKMREFAKKIKADPTAADILDRENTCCDPELCISVKYQADDNGWGHAMQVFPEGDACYVGFDTAKLPYALRWYCRTGDEDGVGIALPTTGTNRSTRYQKEHGLFNTMAPDEHHYLRFNFGYLKEENVKRVEEHIKHILG